MALDPEQIVYIVDGKQTTNLTQAQAQIQGTSNKIQSRTRQGWYDIGVSLHEIPVLQELVQ